MKQINQMIQKGHLVPFYLTKYLQELFDEEVYIQITDDDKFLYRSGKILSGELKKIAISVSNYQRGMEKITKRDN